MFKRALLTLPLLSVFLFCSQSSTQWKFALAFTISFAALAVAGHLIYQLVLNRRSALFEFFFLKVALAQIFFLVAFYLINPLLIVFGHVTDLHWGGSVTFYSIFGVLLYVARKKVNTDAKEGGDRGIHVTHYVLAALFFCGLSRVAGFYSISAGALGSDTHQHIYWTNHIVDWGYLSPAARGTDIVELYAKGLHVLTSIWTSLGFQQLTGSFLKVMPFIQNVLPLAIVIEALTLKKRLFSWRSISLVVLVAAAFFYLTFKGLKLYYPNHELNSTGRLVGAFVTVLPVAFAFASRFSSDDKTRFGAFLWFYLPIFLAFAAVINPSLVMACLVFTLPIVLIFSWPMWSFARVRTKVSFLLLAAGLVVGVLFVVQDPYLLSFLNRAEKGAAIESVLDSLDVYTDEDATAMGKKIDVEFEVKKKDAAKICSNVDCYLVRLHHSFDSNPWFVFSWLTSLQWVNSRPFLREIRSKEYYTVFLSLFTLWFLLITVRSLRERRLDFEGLAVLELLTLVPLFLALQQWFVSLLNATLEADNISFELLESYALGYIELLSIPLAAMVILVLLICTWDLIVPTGKERPCGSGRTFVVCLSLSLVATAAVRRETPWELDPKKGFWSSLNHDDIQAFRNLEKRIPEDDKIVVPGFYWQLGNQHWLFPGGEIAKYLAYGRNKYLFNVRLGEGYRYDWRDFLHRFCSNNPEIRREFLRKAGVKWLLIAGAEVGSEYFYQTSKICQIYIKDLGVIFPPAYIKGGKIAYFRLDPSKIQ